MSMEKTTNVSSASDLKETLRELLNESVEAYALVQTASRRRGDRQRSENIESHLERSVVRPLRNALRRFGDAKTRPDEEVALAASGLAQMDINVVMVEEKLFAVVKQAAVLRLRADAPPELLEAFAAFEDSGISDR
jgi:hypothetical protein